VIDYWRQNDIISLRDLEEISTVVIGCGGIGSPTVITLAKMGVKWITVYDDDKVEPHNLPNQFFRKVDIGWPKVEAIKSICSQFTDAVVTAIQEKVTDQMLSGIVISGVDSMEERRIIWPAIRYNPAIPFYIDGRMGGQLGRIYSLNPCDTESVNWYERTLEGKAMEMRCTAQAIIYNSFMISSLIANQVKKHARAESTAREILFDLQTLSLIVVSEDGTRRNYV
jgi:molybdopterin/thiamine biosynthesis adenylyltransferase